MLIIRKILIFNTQKTIIKNSSSGFTIDNFLFHIEKKKNKFCKRIVILYN